MQKQPELFEKKLVVNPPQGSREPRLWVRRFVIWKEPGGEIVQDVSLRPGLNIVWTPDDQGIGHGGGKTLFCRLLRYCLGEDRFAPEEQRDRIGSAFLNGLVGAEVILDGTCWAVVRPLGNRRRHFAVANGDLDELAAGNTSTTGIDPFLDAVEQSIMTPALAGLIPGYKEPRAWPVALAWLTRDQECRFDHVLDWRSAASDSDSPARNLTKTAKLDALRAFFQAITPEEKIFRTEIAQLDEKRRVLESEIGHRNWETQRIRKALATELKVAEDVFTDGAMAISLLRQAAQKKHADITASPADVAISDIEESRKIYEDARKRVDGLVRKIEVIEAEIPLINRQISSLNGEYPRLDYALQEANSVPCPICEVPIDRALAEGCKVSHKLPDLEACKLRLQRNRDDLHLEEITLAEKNAALAEANLDVEAAKKDVEIKKVHFERLWSLQQTGSAELYSARKSIDDVDRLGLLLGQQGDSEIQFSNICLEIDKLRERIVTLTSQQANAFSVLGDKFDSIIQYLIGQDAKGEIRLSGNGLALSVQMGGDRSTSAIDSLKIVAFDLAALCMSIEGSTRVPAFLIHDSPREADLGLPLYDKLFTLVHWLESIGPDPLFQYVVTTTTRPPPELAKAPWVVLKLSGAPANERLMKCDL